MKRIGFVGLGMMGEPMAANLQAKGFEVVAYDLREEAVATLVAAGATAASRLEDLADCDAVIVMVNTDAQAREVIETLIESLAGRPRPIFSMSTILPSTIRELAEKAAASGIEVLDAPVSGGPFIARVGTLAIMVGGKRELFDRARPVFEAMGTTVTHVGPQGAGLTLKLVNNLIALTTLPVVIEGLYIGVEQGLDLTTMVEVIRASSGNTWITERWDQAQLYLQVMAEDPAQLGPLMETGRKDMELARKLCEEAGIDAPMLAHSMDASRPEVTEKMVAQAVKIAEHMGRGSGGGE